MQRAKTSTIWMENKMAQVNEVSIFSYSFSDIVKTAYSLVLTKIFYRGARLVRRPISILGKKNFNYGKGFTTGKNCRIEIFPGGSLKTGKNCRIGDNVHIVASNKVVLGEECLLASHIFISDTSHGTYSGDEQDSPDVPPNYRSLTSDSVVIGNNVWIGENVCILPGSEIGFSSIIGSNSVVTGKIPDQSIAVGGPAKVI